MKLQTLIALGFDESFHIPFTREFTVRCSSCAAAVINGTPSHETGCRNRPSKCDECGAPFIPERRTFPFQRYCIDCAAENCR